MDNIETIYMISVVVLWVIIGLNVLTIFGNRRIHKEWEHRIELLKQATKDAEEARDKYFDLIFHIECEVTDERFN